MITQQDLVRTGIATDVENESSDTKTTTPAKPKASYLDWLITPKSFISDQFEFKS